MASVLVNQWEVVGGIDKGGIIVRLGQELSSAQAPEKLSTGALVDEIDRVGERLRYRRCTGTGPAEGWVSLRLKEKVLLEPRGTTLQASSTEQPPTAPQPVAPAAQAASPSAPATPAQPVPPARATGPAAQTQPLAAAKTAAPGAATPGQEPHGQGTNGNAGSNGAKPSTTLAARIEALIEKFPGCVDLEVPSDAWKWTTEELEMYFESGGFIKPRPREPPKRAAAPVAPELTAREKAMAGRKQKNGDGVLQFSLTEALQLQDQLRGEFTVKDFQQKLSALRLEFPLRKERGHPHGAAYFEAFESLTMTVYHKVLPRYGLAGDWDGVWDMHARLEDGMKHPKVKRQQEEINTLLGLPRDTVMKGRRKEEEMCVYRPDGDGGVPGPPRRLVVDADDDWAHEFLVEDIRTGELLRRGPCSL